MSDPESDSQPIEARVDPDYTAVAVDGLYSKVGIDVTTLIFYQEIPSPKPIKEFPELTDIDETERVLKFEIRIPTHRMLDFTESFDEFVRLARWNYLLDDNPRLINTQVYHGSNRKELPDAVFNMDLLAIDEEKMKEIRKNFQERAKEMIENARDEARKKKEEQKANEH